MRGRLHEETLERFLSYGQRVLAVGHALEKDHHSRRLIDQLIGSGTSAGANVFEAHEALSKADFVKCLGISTKELSETRFWLKLIERSGYIKTAKIAPLLKETEELMAILKTLIARARPKRI